MTNLKASEKMRLSLAMKGHLEFRMPREQAVEFIKAVESVEDGVGLLKKAEENHRVHIEQLTKMYEAQYRWFFLAVVTVWVVGDFALKVLF